LQPLVPNSMVWWKTAAYILLGAIPFPLAIVLLPMAEGLGGFIVLCVPFAMGGAATWRGYRTSRSSLARGVLLTLGLFYALFLLAAILFLAARILRT